ncbi:alpha-ketoglutarate-dependent dioxygenase AlkB family protein [Billgrantia kenyensis]|uniref:Alpha-ketoglutarate-dependent dioxygenase AlkB n=1 Tax=Billgrantia kenyensis TaxID=321266 RepID=A0A7V9VXP1_9GAMM|nr:alpha-ketoglutarate-dependent dioxygenase AlkB [Halomonas kenyensis]MBA2777345.1 alpha-ketoglutarate-dependent dioxygenase AlkB [Halomonas kenyensis]MCG6660015.1 alpha-ketoglutarate-dependent dioxygenase AlkB [Halomonas kenyensis]
MQGWHTLQTDPPLHLYRGVLGEPAADMLLAQLDRELEWQRPRLKLYGREHPIPRRQVWMGDGDAHYRYSGRDFPPEPWHPAVVALRDGIIRLLSERSVSARFNSVLLNRYADGGERMGWHSDDEPELGPEPIIAAVSLGAERPLRFRWKQAGHEPFNVWLPHDSLLLMGPGCQRELQHALLPRKTPGLRISLTFRHVQASGH